MAHLGSCLGRFGGKQKQRFAEECRNSSAESPIAAALGDREGAVRLLRQAYSEGMVLGTAQRREPEWRPLRDYGPYQEFVRPKG